MTQGDAPRSGRRTRTDAGRRRRRTGSFSLTQSLLTHSAHTCLERTHNPSSSAVSSRQSRLSPPPSSWKGRAAPIASEMRAIARLTQRGGYLLVLRTTASRRMPPALRQGLAGPSPCNIGMMMYSTAPQPLAMTDPHAHKRGDLPRREVTMDDVTVSYARSGGPGGQNVNKLVSRRHATKPCELSCTAVRPPCARTPIALCGHAEYKSGHAVQLHRGRLLARLGQGARSPGALWDTGENRL